jgi:hypothetical protein
METEHEESTVEKALAYLKEIFGVRTDVRPTAPPPLATIVTEGSVVSSNVIMSARRRFKNRDGN